MIHTVLTKCQLNVQYNLRMVHKETAVIER